MNKIGWWRFGGMLSLALVQVSFFNILFPGSVIPTLIINSTMAIVLVRGFRTGLLEWASLLFLYDLLRSSLLTSFVPFGIFVAYITSFVSRRFIFEHRGIGSVLLASLAVLSSALYAVGMGWYEGRSLHAGQLLMDGGLVFITFIPIFGFIQWFESRLEAVSRAEFRGLRKTV